MNKIVYFTLNGKKIFIEWLKTVDAVNQSRIRQRLKRMEQGNLGDCKILAPALYESRLFFGPGYRIYFTVHNGQIILILCGGDKSAQSKDIARAKKYLAMIQGETYDQEK